jgi:hypothetical protein
MSPINSDDDVASIDRLIVGTTSAFDYTTQWFSVSVTPALHTHFVERLDGA